MTINLNKNEDNSFSLLANDETIETYSFNSTIDFHLLMNFLIKQELTDNVELVCSFKIEELSEQETKLYSLIVEIFKLYNEKVVSFNSDENNENSN